MKSKLRLSVLISCYNYGHYLQEAVKSVLDQERPVDEIIVIDDGSTDDTPSHVGALEALDSRVVIDRTENRGQLGAMLRGIALATGDIVFFLDADDLYKPTHTKAFMDIFESQHHVDFVYGDYEEFGDRQNVYRGFLSGCDHDHGRTALVCKYSLRNYGSISSVTAARRELLLPLLRFPDHWITDWPTAGDLAMNLYASLAGGRKMYYFGDTVYYRVHGENDHLKQAQLADSTWQMRRFRANRWVARVASEMCPGDALLQYIDREVKTVPRLSGTEYLHIFKLLIRCPLPCTVRLILIAKVTAQRLAAIISR